MDLLIKSLPKSDSVESISKFFEQKKSFFRRKSIHQKLGLVESILLQMTFTKEVR